MSSGMREGRLFQMLVLCSVTCSFSHLSVAEDTSWKDRRGESLRHWIKDGQQRLEHAIEKWVLIDSFSDSESSVCDWVWTAAALGWYCCRCNQDVLVLCKNLIRTSKESECRDVTLDIFCNPKPWWFYVLKRVGNLNCAHKAVMVSGQSCCDRSDY